MGNGSATERRAVADFEGMLYATALRPLANSLGFFGETAVDMCARSIAEAHPGPFAAVVDRMLAQARNS